MEIDHVVLWVESPERALAFYVEVLDLMARGKAETVRAFTGGAASGGTPFNHVCLPTSR